MTAPVAVFTSPLAANKGIDTVLRAFALVPVGSGGKAADGYWSDGSTGPSRRCRPMQHGIELVPPGGPADVADTLRRGSVFVTAPRATWKWTEQYGLAYLEAMATVRPIVTTVCGTNAEAVRPPNVALPTTRGARDGVDAIPGRRGARRKVGVDNAHGCRRARPRHELRAMGRRLPSASSEGSGIVRRVVGRRKQPPAAAVRLRRPVRVTRPTRRRRGTSHRSRSM